VAPILTCLHWALYERNASPVLSRGNFVDLTLPEAAFDLERSTHVVIARLIDDQERAALASMGFEPAVIVSPTLPGFPEMALWALEPSLTPPKRGPGPAPPP